MSTSHIFNLLLRAVRSRRSASRSDAICTLRNALRETDPDQAAQELIQGIHHSDRWMRHDAIHELGLLGNDRAVIPILPALKDRSKYVRTAAAEALGKLGSLQAVDALIEALDDRDEYVSATAAAALCDLGDPQAIDPLIRVLRRGGNQRGLWTARALSKLNTSEITSYLMSFLSDENVSIRGWIACALGYVRDVQAVPALLPVLSDPEPEVREWAAWALGRLRDSRALIGLIEALNDTDPGVRMRVGFALGDLNAPQALEPLLAALRAHTENLGVAYALSNLGESALFGLIDRLTYDNEHVRKNALYSLLVYFSHRHTWSHPILRQRAIRALIALVNEPDTQIRQYAIALIGRVDATDALDAIIPRTKDEDDLVRWNTIMTLTALNDERDTSTGMDD